MLSSAEKRMVARELEAYIEEVRGDLEIDARIGYRLPPDSRAALEKAVTQAEVDLQAMLSE